MSIGAVRSAALCGVALAACLTCVGSALAAPQVAESGTGASSTSAADAPLDARAAGLKDRADAAMEAGAYGDALAAYRDAYTTSPRARRSRASVSTEWSSVRRENSRWRTP